MMLPMEKEHTVVRNPLRPHNVFVYGTLKSGYGNHEYHLRNAIHVGDGSIEGIMFHLGGCPAIYLEEKWGPIHGEVYRCTDHELSCLDNLEGYPHWYSRTMVPVTDLMGRPWLSALTYHFKKATAAKESKIIPTGLWKGSNTCVVDWLGFDKGVQVGAFSANPPAETIAISKGSRFILKRNMEADPRRYDLIDKETGQVVSGAGYRWIRDMEGKDGETKPVLRLPAVTRPTVPERVKDALAADDAHDILCGYNPPMRRTPPGEGTDLIANPQGIPRFTPTPSVETKDWAKDLEDRNMARYALRLEAQGLKIRKA